MLLAPVPALFYALLSQKLAPAEKNSTDMSAASATFCISGTVSTVMSWLWQLVSCHARRAFSAKRRLIYFWIVDDPRQPTSLCDWLANPLRATIRNKGKTGGHGGNLPKIHKTWAIFAAPQTRAATISDEDKNLVDMKIISDPSEICFISF